LDDSLNLPGIFVSTSLKVFLPEGFNAAEDRVDRKDSSAFVRMVYCPLTLGLDVRELLKNVVALRYCTL